MELVPEQEARRIIDELNFSCHAVNRAAFRINLPVVELIHSLRSNADPTTGTRLSNGKIQLHAGNISQCDAYLIVGSRKGRWRIVTVETRSRLDAMIYRALGRQRPPSLRRGRSRSFRR